MARMELKREGEKRRVSLFYNSNKKHREKSYYWNVIDKNPPQLAQILIDLWLDGYPIDQAYKIMQEKIRRKDWLGL
jgi:hypothetical protein